MSSDVTIGEGKTVITFWGTGKSIETGEMEEINRDCVLEYELDAEVLLLEATPELVENVWDPKESVVCGDTEPKVTGAFGTNITWKQLNLNMNFSYRLGGQVYNQTLINRVENADPRDNVDRRRNQATIHFIKISTIGRRLRLDPVLYRMKMYYSWDLCHCLMI